MLIENGKEKKQEISEMQKKCLANSKDLRKCLFVLHSLFEIVNFKSVCSYYFTASQILLRGSSLRQSVTVSASITWTYENVYASLQNCIKNFTETLRKSTIVTKQKQSKDEMSNMVPTLQVIVAMCLAMCSDEISRQKLWLQRDKIKLLASHVLQTIKSFHRVQY